MPRTARLAVGGEIYHIINRSNGRVPIFHTKADYQHFESLLEEGRELVGMRMLSYCIMPNHFHLVLFPINDRDLGEFMRWVTTTHVRQVRARTNSIGHGHLYQGAYKSFPIETNKHLIDLLRYVEQNPLRAKLVTQAEDWQWSSLWRREEGSTGQKKLLHELPTDLPSNYLESVNTILNNTALKKIRCSVNKGTPFGSDAWTENMVKTYGLESTTRGVGRPRKVLL